MIPLNVQTFYIEVCWSYSTSGKITNSHKDWKRRPVLLDVKACYKVLPVQTQWLWKKGLMEYGKKSSMYLNTKENLLYDKE